MDPVPVGFPCVPVEAITAWTSRLNVPNPDEFFQTVLSHLTPTGPGPYDLAAVAVYLLRNGDPAARAAGFILAVELGCSNPRTPP